LPDTTGVVRNTEDKITVVLLFEREEVRQKKEKHKENVAQNGAAERATVTAAAERFGSGDYQLGVGPTNRVVVSVSASRSRDGLETYQRLVSVSANYVSCPRPIFGLIVQATLIKRTQCERALDAECSEALTFSYQISALSKSCYYHIRELRCLRPYLDLKTVSTIATSIVHSKLYYCNSLYYNLPQSQIKKLQNIQISLARQHLTSLLF